MFYFCRTGRTRVSNTMKGRHRGIVNVKQRPIDVLTRPFLQEQVSKLKGCVFFLVKVPESLVALKETIFAWP